jgi:hypothetical protein
VICQPMDWFQNQIDAKVVIDEFGCGYEVARPRFGTNVRLKICSRGNAGRSAMHLQSGSEGNGMLDIRSNRSTLKRSVTARASHERPVATLDMASARPDAQLSRDGMHWQNPMLMRWASFCARNAQM